MAEGELCMDKKTRWLFVGGAIVILIIFPIITNALMFINTIKVAGNENTWIGFLGSFGGAIIGGVISGAITLVGVRLTIEHAEKNRRIDEYPKKINNLEILIKKLEKNLEEIERFTWLPEPHKIFERQELRLFFIDGNLEVQPTEKYIDLTDNFLFEIKEIILGIDSAWYKDFYKLRNNLKYQKMDLTQGNDDLRELWLEAQDYFLETFEPLTDWKEYAETHNKEKFITANNKIVSKEYKVISEIQNLFFDFKMSAEKYQIELIKNIE